MTDYYLTGHDADDVNSYLIADGGDWIVPPSLPGATDRVAIAGMRSGGLNVAVVLGYSGNFNPAPNLDSPASISGGTVTASSAPLGLLIGNSSGHSHATVTINGDVGGNIDATDGDVTVASVDGDVKVHADATVTADSVTGSVSAAQGGKVEVDGDIDASDGSVAATAGEVSVNGNIVTKGFSTGVGGKIVAGSIAHGGTDTMLNYMDGGEVFTSSYNVRGHAGLSSRLDILDGAEMIVIGKRFGSGRLAGDSDVVNVNGPGSDLELSGNLAVGDAGHGSFTLGSGASVEHVKNLSLGIQKSGLGTISVDGQKTIFSLDGNLIVGDNGQGSLSISGGGIVKGPDDVTLGAQKSGKGTVSIDGKGSGFSHYSGDLVAGDQGQGSLMITGGARASLQDVTVGKQQSGHGDISVHHARLSVFGTMTLGAKGEGTLSITNAGTVELKTLVLGVSAIGDGTVDVSQGELKATKSVTIGENGSGVIALHGNSSFEGEHVSIGSKGKLTVASLSDATLDRVTTIEKDGLLAVNGHNASATLAAADISGRISVSDGGYVHFIKAIVGDGDMTIGKHGILDLGGTDDGVDIRFAASGTAATLSLAHANLLDHAIIKGFAKGNDIEFTDLAHSDVLLSVARRGANTAVTIRDEDGHKLGALTLAGHYAKSMLHLDNGTLTTNGPGKAGAAQADSAATDHDDFHFARHAAADQADADANTSTQHDAQELETISTHLPHDHGW